jgi:hypothetical protein
VSTLAPVTLSSSGARVIEAQPLNNQATATTLIMIFMKGLHGPDGISPQSQFLVAGLRVHCGIRQSRYNCN